MILVILSWNPSKCLTKLNKGIGKDYRSLVGLKAWYLFRPLTHITGWYKIFYNIFSIVSNKILLKFFHIYEKTSDDPLMIKHEILIVIRRWKLNLLQGLACLCKGDYLFLHRETEMTVQDQEAILCWFFQPAHLLILPLW